MITQYNLVNWLNFMGKFCNQEDRKIIRKYIRNNSMGSTRETSRVLYKRFWT